MRMALLRAGKRFLSISQTSVLTSPSASTVLESSTAVLGPQFQVLGKPGSLLAITLVPSVPVYVRKGSLISLVQDSESSEIESQWAFFSFWKSLLYGAVPSQYQKLDSLNKYKALVSSVASTPVVETSKTILNVSLDGRIDWALFGREALQAFSGASLAVSLEKIPSQVSPRLLDQLNISAKTSTGLSRWNKPGFTFVSGRGEIGILAEGQIYRIILQKDEHYVINKDHLVALSINGESDLANCVAAHHFSGTHDTKNHKLSFLDLVTVWCREKYDTVIAGSDSYVKIVGPRNVLVLTNSHSWNIRKSDSGVFETELNLLKVELFTSN